MSSLNELLLSCSGRVHGCCGKLGSCEFFGISIPGHFHNNGINPQGGMILIESLRSCVYLAAAAADTNMEIEKRSYSNSVELIKNWWL